MYKAIVILLAGYFTVTSVHSDHWHYAEEGPNGVVENDESAAWGGMCAAGKRQSPVDLAHDAAIKGEYPGFIYQNFDTPMKTPQIVNNGHSIQISTSPGPISIGGGGLPGTYIFDQMHFHWASEHLINNGRYALELHMVHHEKRYDTILKAGAEKNGIAVLGILFHVSATPNPMIENLLYNTGTVFEAVGRNQTYKDKLLLMDLLPKNKASYFRYEGSLTTPSCGEAVVWTVFENSIPISLDQVERFKSVQDDEGQKLTHNYRHIQPLNSRALVYVKGYSGENSGASFNGFSMTIMILSSVIAFTGFKSS